MKKMKSELLTSSTFLTAKHMERSKGVSIYGVEDALVMGGARCLRLCCTLSN
jgi:hypothetical protein